MPIYAYQCSDCGHAEDVLQRISDAPLSTCPACGKPSYVKQVTAAGFQLKGSGWYVTDFRDSGSKAKQGGQSGDDPGKPGKSASAPAPAAPAAPAAGAADA